MITIHYVENHQHKKKNFNVDTSEYLSVVKLLKEKNYNWYTVDKGQPKYNPDQLTLDFGEIQ